MIANKPTRKSAMFKRRDMLFLLRLEVRSYFLGELEGVRGS
jgi:hypothetical protein